MRILVLSDSHGDVYSLCAVMRLHREADFILFLGDGEDDFFSSKGKSLLNGKRFSALAGNCDYYSSMPKEEVLVLDNTRILAMHGHTMGVKYDLQSFIERAKSENAAIAVHGHTHRPHCEYTDGIHILCPGAVKDGSYGIIDITDKGIICFMAEL